MQVNYTLDFTELARANCLFIEKKPFIRTISNIISFLSWGLISLTVLKLSLDSLVETMQLSKEDTIILLFALIWLAYHRSIEEQFILYRLRNLDYKKNQNLNIQFNIEDKITWLEKKQYNYYDSEAEEEFELKHEISFSSIQNCFRTRNGFVLALNNNFIWLPFKGFETINQINLFQQCMQDQHIPIRACSDWVC